MNSSLTLLKSLERKPCLANSDTICLSTYYDWGRDERSSYIRPPFTPIVSVSNIKTRTLMDMIVKVFEIYKYYN